MIVLAGSECPGIHLVEFTALVVKFPVYDRQQHRRRAVLQGLAKAALAVVSASAVFGGFRGAFLQAPVVHVFCVNVVTELEDVVGQTLMMAFKGRSLPLLYTQRLRPFLTVPSDL